MGTIHCVTPNPALDITYRLPAVELHQVNRVRQVTDRPGGKGVNVARLVSAHGHRTASYGFLGGAPGEQLRELLATLDPAIDQRWTATQAQTRLTIAVVDEHDTTMFNEPGRPVTDTDWDQLTDTLADSCCPGDVVTISGSLPDGSQPAQLATLVTRAKSKGAVVIVDTSGPGLLAAAQAGADVLKPNQHELLEVTGTSDVQAGITSLLAAGAGAVVASLGADGLILGTEHRTLQASLGRTLVGNPTGAGDALVGALAAGLNDQQPTDLAVGLAVALPSAVAWSAAAVLAPVAGEIDADTADLLTTHVTTKEF